MDRILSAMVFALSLVFGMGSLFAEEKLPAALDEIKETPIMVPATGPPHTAEAQVIPTMVYKEGWAPFVLILPDNSFNALNGTEAGTPRDWADALMIANTTSGNAMVKWGHRLMLIRHFALATTTNVDAACLTMTRCDDCGRLRHHHEDAKKDNIAEPTKTNAVAQVNWGHCPLLTHTQFVMAEKGLTPRLLTQNEALLPLSMQAVVKVKWGHRTALARTFSDFDETAVSTADDKAWN